MANKFLLPLWPFFASSVPYLLAQTDFSATVADQGDGSFITTFSNGPVRQSSAVLF